MPDPTKDNLTPRQQAWFASVEASLERDTGKPLAQWVDIVRRECPEKTSGKQAAWLKAAYGLGVNRAAQILNAAFPPPPGSDTPEAERAALWADPASSAILMAFEAAIASIPDVIPTQRKAFTAWSRKVQFAALKPMRGGGALLGLALAPESDSRLMPARKDSWSERLKSCVALQAPADINDSLVVLVRSAWERS